MLLRALLIPLLFCSFAALSDDRPHLDKADALYKAQALDKKAVQWLGVDLKALSYLVLADFDSESPYTVHIDNSQFKYYEQLEKAGYIKIEVIDGSPDGSASGKQLKLVPLMKGLEVQAAVSYESQVNAMDIDLEHRACMSDSDCSGVIATCNWCCQSVDSAVNRQWESHYTEKRNTACYREMQACSCMEGRNNQVTCVQGLCRIGRP